MCRLAAALMGQPVRQKTFEEVDWVSELTASGRVHDCCTSDARTFDLVLERLTRSLRAGGVLYVSFKKRDGDWEQGGKSSAAIPKKVFRVF